MSHTDQNAQIIALFCRLHMNAKKDLPIRSSEMGLLIYLVKQAKAVTPLEAAQFLQVSKSRITQAVNQLVSAGYIEKSPSLTDKRSIHILPTAAARQLVLQTEGTYFQNLTLLEERMGAEDFQTMISLLSAANKILLEEAWRE